jgi:hypothetical protein
MREPMSNLMLPQAELVKLDPMTSVSRALLTLKMYKDGDRRMRSWVVLETLDLLREAMLIQDAKDRAKARRRKK